MQRTIKLLGSQWVFKFTLWLFAAEAAWLACTSRYPMAFDEEWHFSLIKFYTTHWSPIVSSQAASTDTLGNIVQNPSFLYHYLFSFPDRLMAFCGLGYEAQIIGLRLLNVALGVAGLAIAHRLLRAMHLSKPLANVVLILYALTPVVTVLSAQINYDNLLIPLIFLCLYETILFVQKLNKKTFDIKRLLALLCLCMTASLVQFEFLPVFFGIALVVGWKLFAYWRHTKAKLATTAIKKIFKKSFAGTSRRNATLLIAALAVSGFLFVRLYVVNLVQYGSLVPQCNEVLGTQACEEYYSWDIVYADEQYNKLHPIKNEMSAGGYTARWVTINVSGIFGEVMPMQGPFYASPQFYFFSFILFCVGILSLVRHPTAKAFRSRPYFQIVLVVSFVYALCLWGYNYRDYVHLDHLEAIDGRYMVPDLLALYALFGLAAQHAFNRRRERAAVAKLVIIAFAIGTFVCYGGLAQYRSQVDPVYGRLGSSIFTTMSM